MNVTEQIVAYIRQNAEEGNWLEGEKIPSENQLTRELGVSRASVRTAIQYLTGIGVLESVHGKGTYLLDGDVKRWGSQDNRITHRDCRDIEKVLEFRQILEPEACYLAILKGSSRLVERLLGWLEEMKKAQGQQKEFVRADLKFHEEIARASGNSLVYKSLHQVFTETARYHEKMNDIFGYQEGIRYHTALVEAFRKQDAVLGKELMYEHLHNGREKLV